MLDIVDNPEKTYREGSQVDPAQANQEPTEEQKKEMEARQKIEDRKKKVLDFYFANKPRKEIANELMKKSDDYYEYMRTIGRHRLLQRVYEFYYAGQIRRGQIQRTGEQDEYFTMGINHFRNIIQHILNKTTESKPVPEPKTANTDHKSMAQTIVARGVLDHYNRVERIDRKVDRGAETAMVMAEAYTSVEWDPSAGEDYAPDQSIPGQFHKKGEIDIRSFNPLTVAYDFTNRDPEKRDWIITVRFENKYNYAAKFPELAERIKAISLDRAQLRNRYLGFYDYEDSDIVPIYRFYHDKTPAVEAGRFVEFLSSSLVTLDGPLPYRKKPVYRLVPDELEGTCLGYTVAFELLPLQEALDGMNSTILTNLASFGVSNIAIPDGQNIGIEEVMSGLNLVKYDPKFAKPEVLNLAKVPPEIFKYFDILTKSMETISAVNAVVRGDPGPQVESGSYAALLASQTIEFNLKLQKSYAQHQEDVYTGILDILKQHADQPRLIEMAGKSKRSYLKEFTKEDISDVQRVTVDVGNPLSRTTAGKLQLADTMLDRNLIKTAEEFLMVATTGNLEPLYEAEQSQLMLIRAENERLSDEKEMPKQLPPQIDPMTGAPMPPQFKSTVTAILTDDHILHIKEHMSVLSSPESRMNPGIVENSLSHINEHKALILSGDPLLGLMGQPILAPPPMPPGGPGDGGKPPPGPGPGTGKPPPGPGPRKPDQDKKEEIKKPNMPSMPKNPLTNQRFNNENGGLK
jgi:hypothetical protein